jgi:formamidopyrimidine-DNA glycosylase
VPELPEVEVTRLGIAPHLVGKTISAVTVRHHGLRHGVPRDLARNACGQTITAVRRRGKYLLLDTPAGTMIIHLGMSGSLRVLTHAETPGPHDHVDIVCNDTALRFHDPRRFGAVLWHPKRAGLLEELPLLKRLGAEPFDPTLTADEFYRALQRRHAAIKTVLLSGQPVVGVGNIYASESLFRAGIHPCRRADRISLERCHKLLQAIRAVLKGAIEKGGSSLRDFVDSSGESGYFQLEHQVYGREGKPCRRCGTLIRQMRQGQRATFYCPSCQK